MSSDKDPDEWLRACYWSPLSGMRDVAANLLIEWGHRPEDHTELLDEMEIELSGALIETAADMMRDRGLPDLRVQPEGSAVPIWKCADCDTNNDRAVAECIVCGRTRPVSRVRKNLLTLTNSGRKEPT
ncbi:hypothetical protein [Streptomyces ureilyticus]|uniref:RanBP2-type domain-containing protein n=1 Tax=Streptomyces ureilyticus TaxID=1775131 RepID=A0ABX0DFK3_9ACTN|nr:hypothetical protein [Streptomyces ureilyticus]NGO40645.1 hypothetical protein [Streptomyces ureilyticus]